MIARISGCVEHPSDIQATIPDATGPGPIVGDISPIIAYLVSRISISAVSLQSCPSELTVKST
jgi:hypothetical protein